MSFASFQSLGYSTSLSLITFDCNESPCEVLFPQCYEPQSKWVHSFAVRNVSEESICKWQSAKAIECILALKFQQMSESPPKLILKKLYLCEVEGGGAEGAGDGDLHGGAGEGRGRDDTERHRVLPVRQVPRQEGLLPRRQQGGGTRALPDVWPAGSNPSTA